MKKLLIVVLLFGVVLTQAGRTMAAESAAQYWSQAEGVPSSQLPQGEPSPW